MKLNQEGTEGGLTFDAQEALLFIIGGLLKLIDDVSAELRRHGGYLPKRETVIAPEEGGDTATQSTLYTPLSSRA